MMIDQKTNYLKSSLTLKTKRVMNFYCNEMSRAIWSYNVANPIIRPGTDIINKVSQSISSFLESRIQYSISFADAQTIAVFFNIHKKAICSLLGFTASAFGFRFVVNKDNYVDDLYTLLDKMCSDGYRKLCMQAGKPSLMGIAYRAVKVVNDQLLKHSRRRFDLFSSKMRSFLDRYSEVPWREFSHLEPKKNKFFEAREQYSTLKERKIFVRASVDCLLLTHLYARGYETPVSCRICGEHDETLQHVLSQHIHSPLVTPGLRRSIGKYSKRERLLLPQRAVLFPDAEICFALTAVLRNCQIPNKLPYRVSKNPRKRSVAIDKVSKNTRNKRFR